MSTVQAPTHPQKISLIEGKAKSRRLKSNLENEFAAAVYLFEAPSLPMFLIGVGMQFCKF
jgi:hypothetical protein